MSEHASVLSEFSRTIWAKLLGVLTAIMMMLGIYIELVTAWRGTNEALITATNVQKAKAEADLKINEAQVALEKAKNAPVREKGEAEKIDADRINAESIARESALRQEAERREKQALADRANAERINAESIARESALRQEAERREKQAVADLAAIKAQNAPQREKGEAEKLEGEGKNAQATGKYADARRAAEAELARQKARSEAASADINEVVAGMVTGGPG